MINNNEDLIFPIGEKLIIIPSWMESPDTTRIHISIHPGAFGMGTHPTTRLCLELLEKYLLPEMDVIDVGCGSGILSIGALKLGARRALAVDIEDEAIQISSKNAQDNGVMTGFLTGTGSVVEILSEKFAFQNAPLVLANIQANTIMRLFSDGLGQMVSKDGFLILSGILEEQADNVIQVAGEHGLKLFEKRKMGDWVALVVG